MPFNQNIAAFAMFPAMLFPMCIRARRFFPSPGFPVVGIPIPAMDAVDPDIFASRGDAAFLNQNARRGDAHEDVRGQTHAGGQDPRKD